MNIQVDPTSSNLASAMLNSKIRPRAVVGYGVKIFHPSPPNYVTRSPGKVRGVIFEGRMEEKKPPKRLRTGLVDRINDGGNENGEEGTVCGQSTHALVAGLNM